MSGFQECFSCKGHYLEVDGPTHDYMLSTPGCWAAYGEILEREYSDQILFKQCHRLTVDAYALQHKGDPLTDERAFRSIWLHYMSLHAIIEHDVSHQQATILLGRLKNYSFPQLPKEHLEFNISGADVIANSIEDHRERVTSWAKSSYLAWSSLKEEAEEVYAKINGN